MRTSLLSLRSLGAATLALALAVAPASPSSTLAQTASHKSETVHVQTDASGDVSEVTVDDVLINDNRSSTLDDRTRLSNIEPAEDEHSYTQTGDGMLSWSAQGQQVSYKGASDDTPPINVRIAYTLDGEGRLPSELAGKSGHLVIRVDYALSPTITQRAAAKDDVTTPFVCMTVALLDNNVFSNVRTQNAKVVEDKGGTAVVGIALPGLQKSLDLKEDALGIDLEFPEYVQIEADVRDFAMDSLYTVVTPELFYDMDTKDLSLDLEGMDEGSAALTEAMDALATGSGGLSDALSQLAAGSTTLSGGAGTLRAALEPLAAGVRSLSTGAHTLSDGIGKTADPASQLADGASSLQDAAQATTASIVDAEGHVQAAQSKSGELRQAIDQALSLPSMLDAARSAASDAHAAAAGASDALAQAQQGATASAQSTVDALKDAQTSADNAAKEQQGAVDDVTAAHEALDNLSAIPTDGLSEEQKQAIEGAITSAKDSAEAALNSASAKLGDAQEAVNGTKDSLVTAQNAAEAAKAQNPADVQDKLSSLDDAAGRLAKVKEDLQSTSNKPSTDELDAELAAASASLSAAEGAATGAQEGAAALYEGADALASGLDQLEDGSGKLAKGADKLADSMPSLTKAQDQLAAGATTLANALDATAAGSEQLTDGLFALRDQGIAKIAEKLESFGTNVDDTRDRLDALRQAARDYNIFAGKASGTSSSVRFIYKTEQIG